MSLIQNVVVASSSGSTVTSASLGSVAANDYIVVFTGSPQAGTGTGPTDNATGNTYTKLWGRNDGSDGGSSCYYSKVTNGNAAFTSTMTVNSSTPITIVVWWLDGTQIASYNGDAVNNANFSGSSTAFTVGPTTPAPSGNSIFFYGLSAGITETGTPEITGYNTTGVNGFTSTMATAARQFLRDSTHQTCLTGYTLSSSAQTPAVTLATGASWFGGAASFLLSSTTAVKSQAVRGWSWKV